MDPFVDGVSKKERRHLKHGLADVETKHSVQRKRERWHQGTRPVTVCGGGRRIIVTHVPTQRPPKTRQEQPEVISQTVETTLGAGKLIGKQGCNLRPLQLPGISVHVETIESKTQCTISGRNDALVMRTLARLNALIDTLSKPVPTK